MALVAACSGPGDDAASSASAITSGRFVPSSAALLAGERVRLAYDDAPAWTSTKACAGKLKPGGKVLGEYLVDRFAIVSSVGGYACRRNTADLERMSVHGTGRALDVFIPTVNGTANNAQGDKVANWLILNAQKIGVQLIIWDHSIWRANGTNDATYGGPIPHIDHLHVELTNEAAAHSTRWFTTDDDAGEPDGSTATTDAGDTDTDTDDAGATPEPDAAPPPPKDAGGKDAAAPPEPDAAPPSDDTTVPPAPDADPSAGQESAGDAPGETNSLPTRPTRKPPVVDEEPPPDLSGCSAAPGSPAPMRSLGSGLALMLGLGAWLRRRRR
ncbi:MAG TPA: MYXO-CTERM sorting domain-containing protein [Labilithrix sp.]|nr:MYXO-CTERM sorting domain-containing protein [Labilithrix sp.]